MKLGIDLCDVQADAAGGKDVVPVALVSGFARLGHAEDIICFCRRELVPVLEEISSDIKIHILPDFHLHVSILRSLKRTLVCRRLKNYAVDYGVDAFLFTNKFTPNIRFPMKTAMITHDIQCFTELHKKLPFPAAVRRMKEQLQIRNDFRNRDLIIAISNFDASMCREHFPEYAEKVRRIYNPVSVSGKFFPKQAGSCVFRTELSGKYITALNIQWEHKNTLTLIKAFERIRDQVPLDLILVGKTPPNLEMMINYTQDHHLNDRVSFTGFVSDDELERIISETRIYVNPSFFEGFGLTAIEMLIHGIPSVVADCTASPETTQGFAAVYSPPEDDITLSEVILREWNDPVSTEKRRTASDELKKLYDRDYIAAQYWSALSDLIQ